MDNQAQDSNPSTDPIADPEDMPVHQLIFNAVGIVVAVLCIAFDVCLLAATYRNRRDTSLPLAYIAVMCITGIVASFAELLQLGSYQFLSGQSYQVFMMTFGKEATLIGTYSYLNAFFVSLLMTVNRVVVVIFPFNSEYFTQTKIFVYSAIIAVLMLISMLIPYFSPCSVTFNAHNLTFVSGCAPERHPITSFQNKYAIIVPFCCMFANLVLIIHLRFFRTGTYTKISYCFFGPKKVSSVMPSFHQQSSLSKLQARRDLIMMRQTISVAIFFSIYELGAFLMRFFPDEYASLPQIVRDGYFYIRFFSVPTLNFFIYYMETGSTRRMLRRFLRVPERNNNSNVNPTVVTVAPKAGAARNQGRIAHTAASASPVA